MLTVTTIGHSLLMSLLLSRMFSMEIRHYTMQYKHNVIYHLSVWTEGGKELDSVGKYCKSFYTTAKVSLTTMCIWKNLNFFYTSNWVSSCIRGQIHHMENHTFTMDTAALIWCVYQGDLFLPSIYIVYKFL